MINTDKKTIYFGYGDVQLYSAMFVPILEIREFKPPVEVGTEITDEIIKDNNLEYIGEPITITFKTIEELNNFKNLVKEINEESIKYFKYSDYIFDFSNYNPKSIEALLKNIKYIEVALVLPLAA